ncbi:SHOCT domain-containing protein [Pseudodesulfovibrio methanolicus]|uniref:SHOCT domain-containing protein n=1 Tax=Pseudodesulfovibrio methanolicus TaxID=3126690 RepID=A0ABZ2IYR4_9BACT
MTDTYLFLTAQQPMYNGGGGPGWGGGMNMMYSPFGGWFMILLLVVVVVAVAMIFKGSFGKGNSTGSTFGSGPESHAETPLDILKRRYAAGEIDKEQYEQMKRDLTK